MSLQVVFTLLAGGGAAAWAQEPAQPGQVALRARGAFLDHATGLRAEGDVVCVEAAPGSAPASPLVGAGRMAQLRAASGALTSLRIGDEEQDIRGARLRIRLDRSALDLVAGRLPRVQSRYQEGARAAIRAGLLRASERLGGSGDGNAGPADVIKAPLMNQQPRVGVGVRARVAGEIRAADLRVLRRAARAGLRTTIRAQNFLARFPDSAEARWQALAVRRATGTAVRAARRASGRIARRMDEQLGEAFQISAVGAADFFARVRAREDNRWFREALVKAGPPVQANQIRVRVKAPGANGIRIYDRCSLAISSVAPAAGKGNAVRSWPGGGKRLRLPIGKLEKPFDDARAKARTAHGKTRD